jgi:hypothetical protein
MMVPGPPVMAVMPFGHGDVSRDRHRYGARLIRVSMHRFQLVGLTSAPSAEPAVRPMHSAEDQHPSAPHPELASVADERREDVDPERDEGDPDDPSHDLVHAFGEPRPEGDRHNPDHEHDESVSERVDRAVLERPTPLLL